MSKIDIAIRVTSSGAGEPFVVNGGEWTRHITDVRLLLGNLKDIDKEHQIAHILKFTDEGCQLIVSRLISGRSGDNIAAWIHIPATAEVSGSEVVRVMKLAESVIQKSSVNMEPLNEFATKEYPDRNPYCRAPQGQSLAFRRYDSINLPQLLGDNRYQPYYDRYQYIYLLDMESSVDIADGIVADDLTRQLVEPISMLLPPKPEDLRRHFGHDVSVTLADGTPFGLPVAVKKGEIIVVYFVREGFNPLKCDVKKNNSEAFSKWNLPPLQNVKWTKTIDENLFRFVDERGKELPADVHPTIKVNGQELGASGMEMMEGNLRQVNVVANAKAQGYEGDSAFFDLSQSGPFPLKLRRRVRDYNNKVEMRNGKTAEMTLTSKYMEDSKDGPLAGYTYDRATRHLVYDKSRVWAHRAQGLLAGLLLMGLCWGITAIVGSQKKKTVGSDPIEESVPALPSADTTSAAGGSTTDTTTIRKTAQPDNTSIEAAIAYLDGNRTWVRTDMEGYAHLSGLFDAMNNFDLDELTGFWKEQLKDSKRFKDVADWAQSVKSKEKNPATGKHSPTYNKQGNEMITVQYYINWLYETIHPKQTSAPKKPSSGASSQGTQNANNVNNSNKKREIGNSAFDPAKN